MDQEDDIRTAIHTFYQQQQQQQLQQSHTPIGHHRPMMHGFMGGYSSNGPGLPTIGMSRSQSHTVNLLSEDFIAGYMDQGRMSVVRRFFCLFVTFDVVFITLLWIISVVITGENVIHALKSQVLHYSIYTSLFDVVIIALIRFIFLILFYGILSMSHWLVIALSTTSSCAFLICKVFMYNWTATPQPVFEVLLIVVSFVLAWGEAWFLDCRVIPQERYARSYPVAVTSAPSIDARTPLLDPFLRASIAGRTESIGNFYSPFESIHNSDDDDDDDEENAQDDVFKALGTKTVRFAYSLLESDNWKIEKVTSKGDTIQSSQVESLGKVYKLTAKVHYPARKLLQELFYKIEDVPKWNPTLLESRIIRKIDSHTDISYQATIGGGGGVVKSRDFVNLRCWQLCRGGRVYEGVNILSNPTGLLSPMPEEGERTMDSSVSQSDTAEEDDDDDGAERESNSTTTIVPKMSQSHSEAGLIDREQTEVTKTAFKTLSKSLGAQDFAASGATSDPEDVFSDALTGEQSATSEARGQKKVVNGVEQPTKKRPGVESDREMAKGGNVYVSAATSIDYAEAPCTTKYIRGENNVSCWAMRELDNQKDHCIFEMLLCLDLKGYIPRYVLDTAYTTLMQDYMTYLRKYVVELRKQEKVPGGQETAERTSNA
ncbi:steroidogenic acute regulatory protein-like [Anopheles bellator]|uniref:steroidogenic acute regulatory protein-like n=1 Tax=Anopheles bellator TaxID=139047 RepID=UPI002648A161|nr:steroidogenic acute regulatory protein-like [Anopheles bellator]